MNFSTLGQLALAASQRRVLAAGTQVQTFAPSWPQVDTQAFIDAWIAAGPDLTLVSVASGQTQSSNPAAAIVPSRATVVAGEAVQFEVVFNNGPESWRFLTDYIKWDFTDAQSGTFDALPEDSEVRPGRSSRHDYGPLTCHAPTTAGSWAPTISGRTLGGRPFTATCPTITVQDPDTVFAGAATIVWTTDGDATGAPSGSVHYTSNASGGDFNSQTIYQAIAAANAVTPRGRLLLKGGQTTVFGDLATGSATLDGIYVDSFGTGKHTWQSAVTTLAGGIFGVRDDTTIRNQIFVGRYDAADPQTSGIDETRQVFSDNFFNERVTFSGVDVSGFDGMAFLSPGSTVSFVNCNITNWCNYGIYCDPENLLETLSTGRKRIRGCYIHQKADVVRWPSDDAGQATYGVYDAVSNPTGFVIRTTNAGNGQLNWAIHGPLRMQNCVGDAITQCRLESYSGWSANGTTDREDQPAIRFNSSGNNNLIRLGVRTVLSGNHIVGSVSEGGSGAGGWGSFQWPVPLYHVAFNTWKGKSTGRNKSFLNGSYGHFALWNNVADAGDVAWTFPNSGSETFSVASWSDLPAGFPNSKLTFFGNTVIDDRARALSFSLLGSAGARSTVESANNLLYSTTSTPSFSSLGEPVSPDYEVPANSDAFEGATGALVPPVDRDEAPQRSADGMSFGQMGIGALGAVQAQAAGEVSFDLTLASVSATAAVATSGQDNYTSPTMSFGTTATDRKMVAMFWPAGILSEPAGDFTVTIGGVTATKLAGPIGKTFNKSWVYIADVPTGADGTVVATFTGGDFEGTGAAFALFRLTGATSASVSDSVNTSHTGPIAVDVVLNDYVIGWHKYNPQGTFAPTFSLDFSDATISGENRGTGTANRDYRAFFKRFTETDTTAGAVTNSTNSDVTAFTLRPSAT